MLGSKNSDFGIASGSLSSISIWQMWAGAEFALQNTIYVTSYKVLSKYAIPSKSSYFP